MTTSAVAEREVDVVAGIAVVIVIPAGIGVGDKIAEISFQFPPGHGCGLLLPASHSWMNFFTSLKPRSSGRYSVMSK